MDGLLKNNVEPADAGEVDTVSEGACEVDTVSEGDSRLHEAFVTLCDVAREGTRSGSDERWRGRL